jgi:hypothetical protein
VKVDFMPKKNTLLYSACVNRDPVTIKLLLDAGANPHLVYDGQTHTCSLTNSDVKNDDLTVRTDLSSGRGYTALFALSSGGDMSMGSGLWSHRANVTFDTNNARSSIEA